MKTRKMISIDGATYELTDEFLSQVLQAAVEGGCSYWADVESERDGDEAGADSSRDFDLSDYVEDDSGRHSDAPFYSSASFVASDDPTLGGNLDLEGIADAIERIAGSEVDVAPAIRSIVAAAVRDGDATDIDAEAADCIVQVGLFDEIIYR